MYGLVQRPMAPRKDIMRLDKFLKVSRIIKRRTVAKEACDGGRVSLNGRIAKAGSEVKEGDVLEIRFGSRLGRYEIVTVRETMRKEEAADMYLVVQEDADTQKERNALYMCVKALSCCARLRRQTRRFCMPGGMMARLWRMPAFLAAL